MSPPLTFEMITLRHWRVLREAHNIMWPVGRIKKTLRWEFSEFSERDAFTTDEMIQITEKMKELEELEQ